MNVYNSHDQSLSALMSALDILKFIERSEWSGDDDGQPKRTNLGDLSMVAIESLDSVISELKYILDGGKILMEHSASISRVHHPKNSKEYTVKLFCAADRLWFDCESSVGIVGPNDYPKPKYTEQYANFLRAVVKPILDCPRFRKFGGPWDDKLPKTHADRMKKRDEVERRLAKDRDAALKALDRNS